MAGQGCLGSYLSRLGITYLSNQNNVRVKPHTGSKSGSKGYPRRRIDLHLINIAKVILYWVFNGQNIASNGIKLVNRGILSSGLT